ELGERGDRRLACGADLARRAALRNRIRERGDRLADGGRLAWVSRFDLVPEPLIFPVSLIGEKLRPGDFGLVNHLAAAVHRERVLLGREFDGGGELGDLFGRVGWARSPSADRVPAGRAREGRTRARRPCARGGGRARRFGSA